ncbi:iron-containing alcohol dehydrogenase [Vagococcus hydrophili]|uniref:Iron-containing alcohol dehydrogenase n=1 Tax=Vagococcus hydrophili TaxID=2714947 RepID=A0A6G8AVK6_9ENTE|nr:iron-containing alcohol dehydrogenase [Vagococcus hydrophili]QIL49098.1 iron-containing alcohol dehydrogenase [Vagococcus hydrophili]
MENFEFQNPTKILFGKNQLEKLNQEIPKNAKVLIIYGSSSAEKSGLLDNVKKQLSEFDYDEYGGIEPNPTYEKLMEVVLFVKKNQINFLLAVGGGSVIDGVKFIAAASCFEEGIPSDILIKQIPVTKALPLGTVLTLSGTGTEMNGEAVISVKSEGSKIPFRSPVIYPKFSILDPTYTYSAPLNQISNGIVDTFTHIMEQYLTYPVDAYVQDRFAESLLVTLIEEGPKVLHTPTDYTLRANLMWASTMAINGIIGSGVPQDWSTHIIGHAITASHNIDHGKTMGAILPAIMEVQKEEKREKLLQYAKRVWKIEKGSEEEMIALSIFKTKEFFEIMGVSTKLSSYGLDHTIIPTVIQSLEPLTDLGITLGERGSLTLDKVTQVLELSL